MVARLFHNELYRFPSALFQQYLMAILEGFQGFGIKMPDGIQGDALVIHYLELALQIGQKCIQSLELIVHTDRKTNGRILDKPHFHLVVMEKFKNLTDIVFHDEREIQGGKFHQDLVFFNDKTGDLRVYTYPFPYRGTRIGWV